MPAAARKGGTDSVSVPHGSGDNCASPSSSSTAAGSGNVFVNGVGAVRKGDAVASHPNVGCSPHAPGLSAGSGTVKVNGKDFGRLGDSYGCGASITSGSANVFVGG
jgi:uncharacterized Zn-binding protein involved in type VI secretion